MKVENSKGGCFCGNIKFEFTQGDYLVANCHCHMCRKTSGAPFVTWVVVPKNTFSYTQGQPKTLQSSTQGRREFCADCGTPMVFYTIDRPDDFDVTTGCLNNPNDFIPTREVHAESKLTWLAHHDFNL
ncbi:MAG: GFA family protein [Marinicella sp.]